MFSFSSKHLKISHAWPFGRNIPVNKCCYAGGAVPANVLSKSVAAGPADFHKGAFIVRFCFIYVLYDRRGYLYGNNNNTTGW